MSKSIIWRSKPAKFEFYVASDHQVRLELIPENEENPFEPVCITLDFEDLKGIEQILSDLRYDLERELRKRDLEKETSDA